MTTSEKTIAPWRERLHEIIFEADTPVGRWFDVLLLWSIVGSVVVVVIESDVNLRNRWGPALFALEWAFTVLFTIEYGLRLISVRRPLRYAGSFFGIVDLLAILPTYLSLFFVGAQSLVVIRAIRLLRIFRVLKLAQFVSEARVLRAAMYASRHKIIVFLWTVLTVIVIVGAMMYLIEGPEHGFSNIAVSMYWAVVTMTTVGYGDLTPDTPLGRFLASMLMIAGYGIIAVPTGIVSVEIAEAKRKSMQTRACPACSVAGHDDNARHCKYCGSAL